MRTGAVLLLATVLLCLSAPAAPAHSVSPVQRPATTAIDALAALPVKGRAPKTGYSREAFGPDWADVDGNGCDTRNDMLLRDLRRTRVVDGCRVMSGLLSPDPYTNRTIAFVYGRSVIDIDHVVSLSDAWQKGAFAWSEARRTRFANDPLNLLAVDYSANRQKGDSDAASWLPANRGYRCPFVARQVAVKARYGLWVTAAEKAAVTRALARCPRQAVPAR